MIKPKIGLKTSDIFYDKEDKIDFDVLEITSKDPKFLFNVKKISKIKEHLKRKDLSFHTQTSRIFSCNNQDLPEFNLAELNIIKAEIITCKILGIKEFIFHMKQEKLTKVEQKIWEEILKFAKKNGVEMIYESNQKFSAEVCLDFLKKFPKVNYNLDLGHLNTAIGNKTLGMDLDKFLDKVKDRTVYIHAHNNHGLEDEHNSIDNGTLDWKQVLNKLDMSKVRKIIMEVRNTEAIIKTKTALEGYFKNGK
ncbi:MAG: sugar phosphate isomerase/epimerase family protein [Nanobdellota archaeon]